MTRLLCDGLDPVDIEDWARGYVLVSVDVGSPAPRDLVADRPRADGTDDRTVHVGARAVTLSIELVESPHTRQALVDLIAPFMHPSRRVTIETATEPGAAPRRLLVRPEEASLTWERPGHLPIDWSFRTVGAPWWLGEERTLDLAPAPPPPGRTYDLSPPRSYPDAAPVIATAVNAGSWDASWVWTIAGPVSRPRLRNEVTGDEVVLRGLELLDGQVAVVDGGARSVHVDGQRRYAAIDQARTTWWSLPPGSTPVSMPVAAATAAPDAALVWSDTYLA
jgi:hypothetical protein